MIRRFSKKFKVEFDSDGGTLIKSQEVKKGEKASNPGNPKKEGYTFKGWYLNEEEYDFDTEVTMDIVITAKWSKNETTPYKIIHQKKLQDGTLDGEPDVEFGYGITGDEIKIFAQEVAEMVLKGKSIDVEKAIHNAKYFAEIDRRIANVEAGRNLKTFTLEELENLRNGI